MAELPFILMHPKPADDPDNQRVGSPLVGGAIKQKSNPATGNGTSTNHAATSNGQSANVTAVNKDAKDTNLIQLDE